MLPLEAPNTGVGAKAVDVDLPKTFPVPVVVEVEPREPATLLPVDETAPNALSVLVILPNRPPVVAIEVEKPGDELATTTVDFGVVKVVNEELTNDERVLLEVEVILGKNGLALLVTEKADDAEPEGKLNALPPVGVTEGADVIAVLLPPTEKLNTFSGAGVTDVAVVAVVDGAPKTEGVDVVAVVLPPRDKPNTPPGVGVTDVAVVPVVVGAPKTEGADIVAVLLPAREKLNTPSGAGVTDVAVAAVVVEAPKSLLVGSEVLPTVAKDGELDLALSERA